MRTGTSSRRTTQVALLLDLAKNTNEASGMRIADMAQRLLRIANMHIARAELLHAVTSRYSAHLQRIALGFSALVSSVRIWAAQARMQPAHAQGCADSKSAHVH
eukprot:m51a1_g14341 hypothetical protein (104) ;mRNA; r:161115-161426